MVKSMVKSKGTQIYLFIMCYTYVLYILYKVN